MKTKQKYTKKRLVNVNATYTLHKRNFLSGNIPRNWNIFMNMANKSDSNKQRLTPPKYTYTLKILKKEQKYFL